MKEKQFVKFSVTLTLMDLEQLSLLNSKNLLKLLVALSKITKLMQFSISMMLTKMEN